MTVKFEFFGLKELNASIMDYFVLLSDIEKMHKGAVEAFFEIEKKLFVSEGGTEPWQPLTDKYNKWKFKNFPGQSIMTLTGDLRNALTGRDRTNLELRVIDAETSELVLYNNYWHNHQYGTTMPVRKTVNITEEDGAFIVDAMMKATLGGRLSRLFTRR